MFKLEFEYDDKADKCISKINGCVKADEMPELLSYLYESLNEVLPKHMLETSMRAFLHSKGKLNENL